MIYVNSIVYEFHSFINILDFQDAFSLLGNPEDTKISISQLGEVLRALGPNPTEAEITKYYNELKPGIKFLQSPNSYTYSHKGGGAKEIPEGGGERRKF